MKSVKDIYRLTGTDYRIFLALFLFGLIVYSYTMSPAVGSGNTGELTCAAYFLGGAHAPGLPFYCIIGKLFMWLFSFIGRIDIRMNFLSAFAGASAISISYLVFVKFLGRLHNKNTKDNLLFAKIPAIAASLFFLFSKDLWAQSIIAEVYSVSTFFLPLMFLIVIIYEERIAQNTDLLDPKNKSMPQFLWNRNIKIAYLFFFIYGIALGSHYFFVMGFFIPFALFFIYPYVSKKTFIAAVILFLLIWLSKILFHGLSLYYSQGIMSILILLSGFYLFYRLCMDKPKLIPAIVIGTGFLILGLLIYVYMPIRSMADTPLDWGNPERWRNFLFVVQRRSYRGYGTSIRSLDNFIRQIIIIIKLHWEQFTPVVYLFTFLGLVRIFKLNKKWFYFLLSFSIFFTLTFIFYNNFRFNPRDIYFARIYYIPSYVVNLFWIAAGMEYLLKLIEKYGKKMVRAAGLLLILLALLPLTINFKSNNHHNNSMNYNYGKNLLKTTEYRSILFTEGGDNQVFSLLYLNYIEYLRPDLNDPYARDDELSKKGIFDQKGNVFLLYGDMMGMTVKQLRESLVTNDYGRISTGRPIYYTWKDHRRQKEINKRYNNDLEYRRMGILYRVCKKGTPFIPPINYWLYYDFAWQEFPNQAIQWDYLSREIIANDCFQHGDVYMHKAKYEYDLYMKNISDREKNRYHFKQYEKYENMAFDRYRLSKKFGFDMTAIHFNLALLLVQRIKFLDPERDIEEINKIYDEAINNYITAAEIEQKGRNAARAYMEASKIYKKQASLYPDREAELMKKAWEMYNRAQEIKSKY